MFHYHMHPVFSWFYAVVFLDCSLKTFSDNALTSVINCQTLFKEVRKLSAEIYAIDIDAVLLLLSLESSSFLLPICLKAPFILLFSASL